MFRPRLDDIRLVTKLVTRPIIAPAKKSPDLFRTVKLVVLPRKLSRSKCSFEI